MCIPPFGNLPETPRLMMKGTQNLTLASKFFCGAVTHDLLTVENNIDFALRSWDQQCFHTIYREQKQDKAGQIPHC